MVKGLHNRKRDLLFLSVGLLLLVIINFVASFRFYRFDLTSEKRYSLSDSTKSILRQLDDVALVTVYLEHKDLPFGFKRLRTAVIEQLDEFRHYGGENFQYRFLDPFENAETRAQREERIIELSDQGLIMSELFAGKQGSQQVLQIFPGAIVSYKGSSVPVKFLETQFKQNPDFVLNQSIERLEYNLSKGLYQAMKFQNKKRVAFGFGQGELHQRFIYDMVLELREFYEVTGMALNGDLDALNATTDCLIIAKPDSAFDDGAKFMIDQYIMGGGRVLWLIDNVFAEIDSMKNRTNTIALPKDLNIYEQLFKYGVRINPNLVQDASSAIINVKAGSLGTQAMDQAYQFYYFPVIIPKQKHPIVKNISAVKLEFASTIDTVKAPGVKKTILLSTSELTKVILAPASITLGMLREEPTPEKFDKPNQAVAVLLEGTFRSVFENRIVPLSGRKMLTESKPTKMIVVSDGDIIRNQFFEDSGPVPLGYDRTTGKYYPGNKTFLLNAVNYLTEDNWFIPLRSKQYRIRVLNKDKVKSQKTVWQAANVASPVLLILVFGLTYNEIRKRRFARSVNS